MSLNSGKKVMVENTGLNALIFPRRGSSLQLHSTVFLPGSHEYDLNSWEDACATKYGQQLIAAGRLKGPETKVKPSTKKAAKVKAEPEPVTGDVDL